MSHAQTAGHTLLNGAHDAINGDKGSLVAVHNGINGISATINGNSLRNLPSPATDSPATPVSAAAVLDVKIGMEYQEQESDVRHEPLPIKDVDYGGDNTSTVPQVGTPNDSDSIPISPPHSTPPPPQSDPEDVKMAESLNGDGVHMNGHDDVVMDEGNPTPGATPGISADFSMASLDGGSTPATRSYPDDGDDNEPPAKRARLTDPDMASIAHSATPPPASASPAPMPPSTTTAPTTTTSQTSQINDSTLSLSQWRFFASTLRNLKKQKDAGPFLHPVDPVALKIPHYPSIIKNPMDLSTIERKLNSSNPAKPDPNPNNPRYYSAEEFITDFRLIFVNTLTFNGPEHAVTMMGKRVEEVFDKQIKNLPPAEVKQPKPAPVKKAATPPPPPPPVAAVTKKAAPRRPSTSVPVIRRSDAEPVGRPKREIHPPPPKDLPYADAPRKNRKGKKVKDDGTAEQLKYCGKILQELHRKQHYAIANPFYEPVDWQKMDLPSYPKLVRKPMDLSTIRKKLDNGEYDGPQNFYDDFKLMIRNCFTFNPTGTPVNLAGQELQRIFDDKWKHMPPLRVVESEAEDDEAEESEDDRQRKITALERKRAEIEAEIEALRNPPPKEKKKKEKKEKAPVASTSKQAKQPKASKKKSKKAIADDDVLTFEQKKDLSEAIGKLDGKRLERVIQIIHEGVPEIRDSTEEIELEIDVLPPPVLTKLYNYVLRPLRQPTHPKRVRSGKGTGTGGINRKSMDEEKEAEKIRQLEERMALFDTGGMPPPVRRDDDSDHSSDSTSGSDSSESDSE